MKKLLAIFLIFLSVLTVVAAGCSKAEPEAPLAASTPGTTVSTPPVQTTEPPLADPIKTEYGLVSGAVIGDVSKKIHVYKGIPYAAPPVGDLRWRPPRPPVPWTGVLECTEYSSAAPQNNPFGGFALGQSEDCLYLNVLTPANKATDRLPVMVWMHGGGYTFLSGNDPGTNLPGLPQHDVLLVTVNMRLGVLGLLAHPLLSEESSHGVSGNYIFLDMIAALEWVRDNIAAFGGDPGNVTIFGESGGGAKVANLMASPLAKGLFHRAIMESGTAVDGFFPGTPLEDMEALGQDIFARLGVDSAADPLTAARALSWEDVVGVEGAMNLDAAVDGWFLADLVANTFKAGEQNMVPFITVANMGEITGPGILVFPQLIPGYTNMLANAGKAGVKAYAAIFEHVPANWKADGAVSTHMMEMPYVFGDMDPGSNQWGMIKFMAVAAGARQDDPGLGGVDRQLSENIMAMWTQFARTGNPNVPGPVEWPAYDVASEKYLNLDVPLQVRSGFSLIAPKETTPPVPPVGTSTSPKVDGTIERTKMVDNSPPVTENGKQTTDRTVTWAVHGKLEGTWVRVGKVVADMTTGKLTSVYDTTFTGAVDGKEGSFTSKDIGTGQAFSPMAGVLNIESTITDGTGELAGLSGTINIKTSYDQNGQKGTYTTDLSFEE